MAATAERPITLPQTERKQVQDLEAFLGRGNAVLLSSTGERIDLPNTVFEILRRVVTLMAHGQAVTLVPDNQAVTTQRAADILGMSRPFFVKLLETGAGIPPSRESATGVFAGCAGIRPEARRGAPRCA